MKRKEKRGEKKEKLSPNPAWKGKKRESKEKEEEKALNRKVKKKKVMMSGLGRRRANKIKEQSKKEV